MKNLNKEDIALVLQAIKNGNAYLLPTNIGYEIICDGTNSEVINNVLQLLNVSLSYNYSLVVNHIDQISRYTRGFPEVAEELLSVASSPLILVLPTVTGLPLSLILEKDKAPFRIVSEGVASAVAQKFNRPLLAIPASGNYNTTPKGLESVPKDILSKVAHIESASNIHFQSPSIIELGLSGEVKIIKH